MSNRDDDRDHPLSCQWRPVAAEAYEDLVLPTARSNAAAIVQTQILTEAYVIGRADKAGWISYSRRREFYTSRRGRYWPSNYTYDMVVPAVDQLAAYGLLEHEKMPPGHLGQQSRFKASDRLHYLLNEAPLAVIHDPLEVIILRDKDGQLVNYGETERSTRMRRNAQEINEAILSEAIGIQGITIRDGDPLSVCGVHYSAASNQLHRVFNRGSFSLGGRFYGPWWQNIPSESRADITISGSPTIELDYPQLHPTLLYAEVGKPMRGDPYALPDWPRKLVKVAFNTLVNADTRLSAIRSIAQDIGGEGAFSKARALVGDIEAKHRPIANMFGTGAGLRLMRRDSDMTERLLLKLNKCGIVALPIHDSYIVRDRSSDKGELMEAMAEVLHKSVTSNAVNTGVFSESIPQYGACLAPPVVPGCPAPGSEPAPGAEPWAGFPIGSIVVFFPEQSQRDLFGGDTLAVPVSDVLGWRRGPAPVGVQQALRHEMRRRDLRHGDVANHIGISRPQFENILQGRFGASPSVADRLRRFLIEGAKTVGTAA